ncbi:TPA: hypothetical protein ACSJ8D_003941, partial [Escherichia coli]
LHKSQYRVATDNTTIDTSAPLNKNRGSAERLYRYLTSPQEDYYTQKILYFPIPINCNGAITYEIKIIYF